MPEHLLRKCLGLKNLYHANRTSNLTKSICFIYSAVPRHWSLPYDVNTTLYSAMHAARSFATLAHCVCSLRSCPSPHYIRFFGPGCVFPRPRSLLCGCIAPFGQAFGLLVTVSCMRHRTSTSVLSTPYSPGDLPDLLGPLISHLKGGFTLRCLQRLSLPDSATLPWRWSPTGTPVIRPSRSSRTKDSSSQISYACAG